MQSVVITQEKQMFINKVKSDRLCESIVLKGLFLWALYSNHVVSLINRHPPHVLWIMNFFILNFWIILFSMFFFCNEDM